MSKKITKFLLFALILSTCLIKGNYSKASNSHYGQIVKMEGLSSLYYVAADGKRYVFPNSKIYDSWFSDFNDTVTLSQNELTSLPLGGNVLYRPGILLVKITTDPKVYAVSRGGILRWVKTEAIAKSLYGDNWNLLVDDVPDSFFTNYTIGAAIEGISDFDPSEEADNTNSIDANHGLSTAYAKISQTMKCIISGNMRECRNSSSGNSNNTSSNDNTPPEITNINISNRGTSGYIDAGDEITITFNEEIKASSINSGLIAGGEYNSLNFGITGSINVSNEGTMTINNIASFNIGSVDQSGQFAVRLSLNSSGKVLTITIIGGNYVEVEDEDFEKIQQIGGTITDASGNIMKNDSDIDTPNGTFGGTNVNDGIEPYITNITAYNYGENGYIDEGDEIKVTFSEKIDPDSINKDLIRGGSVDGVEADETGGVIISNAGILTISDIASFYVGDIDSGEHFDVSLSLNSDGNELTITLADGTAIQLDNEDLDNAEQIGGVIEDRDGNEMDDDPNIDDPNGSFVEDGSADDPYITYIKAYDKGNPGYIDENDQIVITFSSELDPKSINNNLDLGETVYDVNLNETGGIYLEDDGLLVITDILSFDMGELDTDGNFEVSLHLSSSGKVLTITIENGDAIEINSENFGYAKQLGGTLEDENNNVMDTVEDIIIPLGTFGGDSIDTPPYISKIEIENGGDADIIDVYDKIIVTFSEGIDPESINSDLVANSYVRNVDDDDTGGINIDDDGILTISDIAEFNVGNVDDNGSFGVKLSLNSTANILTITLTSGDEVEITYQDLSSAKQIGGVLEDNESNEMENDPRINDPIGSF